MNTLHKPRRRLLGAQPTKKKPQRGAAALPPLSVGNGLSIKATWCCVVMGLMCLTLLGCKQRDLQVYEAPSEATTQPVVMAGAEAPQWRVPRLWQAQPATTFRIGSFVVPGQAGDADMSVTFLSGSAGGILSNINRWRAQIQLPPTTEGALGKEMQDKQIQGESVRMVTLLSPDNQTKMLVAIWEKESGSWFFKLVGPEATVSGATTDFGAFLESVTWL